MTSGSSDISVVIPVRDRERERVERTIHSLLWQEPAIPQEVILVSHGSTTRCEQELNRLVARVARWNVRLISHGTPSEPWNKSRTLNIGLRQTTPDVPFVMTMDVDMILAPNFVEVVVAHLRRDPNRLVLCRSSDLPRGPLPKDPHVLKEQMPLLNSKARMRSRRGNGGIQASTRRFFFSIRGYDEDMEWWCAMDNDLVMRARRKGLAEVWIDDRTAMFHQWHPRKQRILDDPGKKESALVAKRRNRRLLKQRASQIERNPDGWGKCGTQDGG